jgi:sugar/nucleoside kinase (ribokinase family)
MARIVVVGSVATDEVVRLAQRCREGAHLNGIMEVPRLGGGGANSALALAAAGHDVTLVTAIGEDEDGDWQIDALAKAGIDVSAIRRVKGGSTRSLVMVDPAGERTIVNLGRAQEDQPPARLLDIPADLVYVRARTVGLAALLAEKGRFCKVVAHIPPIEPGVFPAQVIVASASDLPADLLAEPVTAGLMAAGTRLEWMVLTRGADGAEAFSAARHLHQPSPAVQAVDSTGAGDAFAAGLCHALVGGAEMEDALAVAVKWGAAKVGQDGSSLTAATVAGLISALTS